MERLVDKKKNSTDTDELSLRPKLLNEYIGQEQLKKNLNVFIGAALKRQEALDHCLFFGPPGLGKTTLAFVISNEMKTKIKILSGPSLEKPGDLVSILACVEPGEIVFIDEIHRLPKVVEEILYQAMEDFSISIIVNKETNPRSLTIDLPPFTLIGATTRAGDISSPLRARFGIQEKLVYYSVEELKQIVDRTSKVFNAQIDENASLEIAKRSRGTPRIANRLFRRVRDFSDYKGQSFISINDAFKALDSLGIDNKGLDEVDLSFIKTIIGRYKGGPVGIEAIASAIGEDRCNLEDVCEPFLVQIGFINRTPKGRVVTQKAYDHLGLSK